MSDTQEVNLPELEIADAERNFHHNSWAQGGTRDAWEAEAELACRERQLLTALTVLAEAQRRIACAEDLLKRSVSAGDNWCGGPYERIDAIANDKVWVDIEAYFSERTKDHPTQVEEERHEHTRDTESGKREDCG